MNKIYLTINIVELIHGKLNYFLPKKITDQISFLRYLNNILINDEINNDKITLYHYKTQSIIMLIEKENINNEFKWIKYDTFKNYLNIVLNNSNISVSETDKLIKIIEYDLKENISDNDNAFL